MLALSIRQPWAWLIIHGGKDIENRTWPTKYRGRFLVHAAQGMTRAEYEATKHSLWSLLWVHSRPAVELPPFSDLQRGGIVGAATLVDCIPDMLRESPWHHQGCFGFKLANVEPLPFQPLKGRLGFFEVPT